MGSLSPSADASRPPIDRAAPTDTGQAAFALGCFWDPDARFGAVEDVVRTCVGYAGGTTAAPTYDDIGNHIETVRVEYAPEQCRYADFFFSSPLMQNSYERPVEDLADYQNRDVNSVPASPDETDA